MLNDLLTREPRLYHLLLEAKQRQLRGRRKYEAFEAYRQQLRRLVGCEAERPELRSAAAWETVEKKLCEVMGV